MASCILTAYAFYMKSPPAKFLVKRRAFAMGPALVFLFCVPVIAQASSFRCGTKIVITGDSISRLLDSCGPPSLKYKAQETVRSDGKRQATGVTNWVYARGHKKNMVVSVRSGKVVRIAVE